MDIVLIAGMREFCEVKKGLDEGTLRWFGHVERMERDRIAKSVLVVIQWVACRRDGLIL